jgi:hypothetical protein
LEEDNHLYKLEVTAGSLGEHPNFLEWYGTHFLTGTCGTGSPLFDAEFHPFGSWSTLASFSPFLSGGKYFKYSRVDMVVWNESQDIATVVGVWTPGPLPACGNSDRFRMTPTHIRTPVDDNPASNPYHPNVFEDHFNLVISKA